jgi:hypothetical protein
VQLAWVLERIGSGFPGLLCTTRPEPRLAGEADLFVREAFVSGSGKPVPSGITCPARGRRGPGRRHFADRLEQATLSTSGVVCTPAAAHDRLRVRADAAYLTADLALAVEEGCDFAIAAKRNTLAIEGTATHAYAASFIVTNIPANETTVGKTEERQTIRDVEAWFRRRTDIEDRIREAKLGAALRRLPSGHQAVNSVWMCAALPAGSLSALHQALTGSTSTAERTPPGCATNSCSSRPVSCATAAGSPSGSRPGTICCPPCWPRSAHSPQRPTPASHPAGQDPWNNATGRHRAQRRTHPRVLTSPEPHLSQGRRLTHTAWGSGSELVMGELGSCVKGWRDGEQAGSDRLGRRSSGGAGRFGIRRPGLSSGVAAARDRAMCLG